MSVRAMSAVWEFSAADGSELLLLLAIADHANDRGENAFPSKATLSRKTRQHERTVQSQIQRLETAGELRVSRATGPGGTNEYVVVCALEGRTPVPLGGGETPPEIVETGGDETPPPREAATPWGRIASGDRVISPGEAFEDEGGGVATPWGGRSNCASQTVLQPSEQPSFNHPTAAAAADQPRRVLEGEALDEAVTRCIRSWEQATGMTVTAMTGDLIATWLEKLPEAALVKAFAETNAAGARSWRYAESILQRFEAEGWNDEQRAASSENPFAATAARLAEIRRLAEARGVA